ncbi:receptor-like protein 14 isoform X2 [Manihot esculenta]|uniref:receptor-like protein 14 isoform X2 n=1 Tax=Manihot esculenta TaxID=3983 RepID=UPI001CC359C1|nr:receptor-like protein 14 isoform X2 [Manihot esculenta]
MLPILLRFLRFSFPSFDLRMHRCRVVDSTLRELFFPSKSGAIYQLFYAMDDCADQFGFGILLRMLAAQCLYCHLIRKWCSIAVRGSLTLINGFELIGCLHFTSQGKEWWMGASHFQMELANIAKCLLLGVVILWIQIHGNKGCFEEERLALLDFKAFVGSNGFDADHLLPSWIDDPTSNCCQWERVMCNSTTGHVTELSLNNTRQYDIDSRSFYYDENIWYVNLSMFQQLKELKTLNLSYNHFDCSIDDQGCERLSKLKKVEVLDLTWNRFNNIILPSLGTLTSLKTLILGSNRMECSFPIQGFQRLEELDLSRNNFNNSILSSLAALPSLNTLILRFNYMEGSFPNQGFQRLEELDLTMNSFNNSILSLLAALPSLNSLILRGNHMEGSFPNQGIISIILLSHILF